MPDRGPELRELRCIEIGGRKVLFARLPADVYREQMPHIFREAAAEAWRCGATDFLVDLVGTRIHYPPGRNIPALAAELPASIRLRVAVITDGANEIYLALASQLVAPMNISLKTFPDRDTAQAWLTQDTPLARLKP